jgi:hypothetical protein
MPITVRIFDAGPAQQQNRYQVEVGPTATSGDSAHLGNPGSTLQEALMNAHWEFIE